MDENNSSNNGDDKTSSVGNYLDNTQNTEDITNGNSPQNSKIILDDNTLDSNLTAATTSLEEPQKSEPTLSNSPAETIEENNSTTGQPFVPNFNASGSTANNDFSDSGELKSIADASTTIPDKPKSTTSKKSKFPLLPIIIMVLMLSSAVGVFFLVRSLSQPQAAETGGDFAGGDSQLSETSTEVLFTEETLPRIDASLATQPLMDAFVKNFTGKTTADLGIEYTNTHPSYVKLINNETDLIIVTEPSEEELYLAAEMGVELDVTKVVNEGFAFFVNRNNPVSEISFDNLVKIYTGEITNWQDLGGYDAEIVAYQRPENSGSQTGLYNLVLKGQEVKIPTVKESVTLTMAGIIDYVAAYDNAIDAIGYGFYYYVNTMYYNDNLKYLAVDGVAPTYQTIQDETYPILSAYYIVTRKGDDNSNVKALKQAMLSRRGQYVASEAGYVPVGE